MTMPRPTFLKALLAVLVSLAPLTARADHRDHRDVQYFMTVFGAQGNPDTARSSHTFATFVAVEDDRVLEELTISWLPAPGYFGPSYTMPPLAAVPGHNYTLDETIAYNRNRQLLYWGPYQITPDLYGRARARIEFLNRGSTEYKMFVLRDALRQPALYNQPGGAINCIMAVSDIGGFLDTGNSWGFEASRKVLGWLGRYTYGYPYDTRADVARLMGLPERLQRF